MSIDLHIHSTCSDGKLDPKEIVKMAHQLGLKAISITDHDTIAGIPEAIDEARKYPELIVIPGIEISAYWDNEEIHILGYYIDYKNNYLKQRLAGFQRQRKERVIKILHKLNKLGINISYKDVDKKSSGRSIGRPHIAMALQDKGYVTSTEDAFSRLLSKKKPAYVPRYKLTPFDAINLIKQYKGIPILAHPGLLQKKSIIRDIIDCGIMGIEAYHSKHTREQTSYFEKTALEHKLLITGGSDCHGDPILLGSLRIPEELLYELKNK